MTGDHNALGASWLAIALWRFWIGYRNARSNSRGCEACEARVGLGHFATLRGCDGSISPPVDKYNSLLIHAKRFRISCAAFPVESSSVTPTPAVIAR